jgi:hypothetical protein
VIAKVISGEVADGAFGFLVDDLSVKDNQIGADLDDIHRFLLLGKTAGAIANRSTATNEAEREASRSERDEPRFLCPLRFNGCRTAFESNSRVW